MKHTINTRSMATAPQCEPSMVSRMEEPVLLAGLRRSGSSELLTAKVTFRVVVDSEFNGFPRDLLVQAQDAGLNSFDLCSIDPNCDKRLSSSPFLTLIRRNRERSVISATPAPSIFGDGSRKAIISSVEKVLRLIKSDYVDIFFIGPPAATVQLEESLSCMDSLFRSGKILHIGLCDYPPLMLERAIRLLQAMHAPPSILRFSHSILRPWRISSNVALSHGLGVMADPPPLVYNPQDAIEVAVAQELIRLADEWRITPEHLNLSWLLSRPETVSVAADATGVSLQKILTALRHPELNGWQISAIENACSRLY